MKNFSSNISSFLFLIFSFGINAQSEIIPLKNPSFEGLPRPAIHPAGWFDCGALEFPMETAPDLHPVENDPLFGVEKIPYEGASYLGMVVRQNNSWESIAQKLTQPIKQDQCYSFSIYLAQSPIFQSSIRGKNEEVLFNTPTRLRVWGGNGYCTREVLLAESPLIHHKEWKNYKLQFKSEVDCDFIILEAYYDITKTNISNGHLLIDKASSIIPIDCKYINSISKKSEEEAKLEFISRQKIILKNISPEEFSKVEQHLKKVIQDLGQKVSFDRKNEIRKVGLKNLKSIAKIMRYLPYDQLIINLNGTKNKKAINREKQIEKVLLEEGLKKDDFEIRNSRKKDKNVSWWVNRNNFNLGFLKIKN